MLRYTSTLFVCVQVFFNSFSNVVAIPTQVWGPPQPPAGIPQREQQGLGQSFQQVNSAVPQEPPPSLLMEPSSTYFTEGQDHVQSLAGQGPPESIRSQNQYVKNPTSSRKSWFKGLKSRFGRKNIPAGPQINHDDRVNPYLQRSPLAVSSSSYWPSNFAQRSAGPSVQPGSQLQDLHAVGLDSDPYVQMAPARDYKLAQPGNTRPQSPYREVSEQANQHWNRKSSSLGAVSLS